jgi:hypothetical protein
MSKILREILKGRSSASMSQQDGNVPMPAAERAPWLLAGGLFAIGVSVLVAVGTGVIGSSRTPLSTAPPPVLTVAPTPVARPAEEASFERMHGASASGRSHKGIVVRPSRVQQARDDALFEEGTSTHVSNAWMDGFYPIYATAQHTFGVNWLLLASIHKQESAFSTAPGIYEGLNFAH